MIAKLTGIIDSLKEDSLILNVKGVGYLVFIAASLLPKLNSNSEVSLFIETQVREDSITLFGFLSEDDKKLFNLLKTVQGVGPKLALAIMVLSSSDILNAIMLQDVKKLQTAPGVGAKVAARITSELKDKVHKIFDSNFYNKPGEDIGDYSNEVVTVAKEAIAALKALGYSDKEAEVAVNKVLKQNTNGKTKLTGSVEEIIKQALNYFSAKIQ